MSLWLIYISVNALLVCVGVPIAKRMPSPELARTAAFFFGMLVGSLNILAVQTLRSTR